MRRGAQFAPIGNADCLLKNTSTKHIKYVDNQILEHVEDISFRELFGNISEINAGGECTS